MNSYQLNGICSNQEICKKCLICTSFFFFFKCGVQWLWDYVWHFALILILFIPLLYKLVVSINCCLSDIPSSISPDFMEVMKCEHERAVHLFVDSLMNKDHMSFAFQCTGPDRFKKGICLSCRKNRCNNIGYNTRKMRKRRNSKMYLKTRADTPFGGELLRTQHF